MSGGIRLVGCSGHSKICRVVWSACWQLGQRAKVMRPIRCLVLRSEQYPDHSWPRVVLTPPERLASSSFTSSAGLERTPFGCLLFIAARTACKEGMENLITFGPPPPGMSSEVRRASPSSPRQVICQGSVVVIIHVLFLPTRWKQGGSTA